MTVHNSLKYGSDVQNALEIASGMSQDEEGVVRLGETLTPGIDPWTQPEWAYLRNERLGAGRSFVAAVAAEFPIIELGNASGSQSIVVVDAISVGCDTATMSAFLEVVADATMAGTLSGQAFFVSGRDRRFGSAQGRTFLRTGTDPASTFGVQLEGRVALVQPANDLVNFQSPPIILKPGDAIILVGQTVNTAMRANFKWRERRAFLGELPA